MKQVLADKAARKHRATRDRAAALITLGRICHVDVHVAEREAERAATHALSVKRRRPGNLDCTGGGPRTDSVCRPAAAIFGWRARQRVAIAHENLLFRDRRWAYNGRDAAFAGLRIPPAASFR